MSTLIIAHPQENFRRILQKIIESYAGFHMVGEAATADELLQTAAELQPQVIIAGIALPGMDDTTLQQLALCCKQAKVIISWGYENYEQAVSAAMAGGCSGYIVHDAPPAEYYLAVKEALKGNVYYCSQTERFRTGLKDAFTVQDLNELRSENYRLLIHCVWLGFTSKEAAIATGLTHSTVETYRKRFKQFLGSRSSAAFAEFMKRNGML